MAAFCPWCAHSQSHDYDCLDPSVKVTTVAHWGKVDVSRPGRRYRNKDGTCAGYTPSWWTRLLRMVGRRQPMLIEVEPPSAPAKASPIRVRTGMKTGKRMV